MKVTIFGGSGYVGSYLIDELLERGHQPVLLIRPESRHKVNQLQHCTLIDGDIADPEAIRAAVSGADAAIYNIGILREFPAKGVTYQALHFEGAKRAMDVAEDSGVSRFLLMSANGVKADGTGYQRTKYMAEQYLKTTSLQWTVFRPSVLFGDPRGRMEFATQLYRDIVRSPLPAPLFYDGLLPVNAGMFRMSPVHVMDVATVFVKALDMPGTAGQIYELCGPDALSWKEILQMIAAAAGTTKVALPAPVMLLKGIARILDQYAFFPITRDQLTMLMEGNTCGGQDAFQTFGLEPASFDTTGLAYLQGDD
ncbi:MAG: NAD(P)H-binding protein [Gammaproteobacteria bacterium]|jgi:NADH dehydrogenase